MAMMATPNRLGKKGLPVGLDNLGTRKQSRRWFAFLSGTLGGEKSLQAQKVFSGISSIRGGSEPKCWTGDYEYPDWNDPVSRQLRAWNQAGAYTKGEKAKLWRNE